MRFALTLLISLGMLATGCAFGQAPPTSHAMPLGNGEDQKQTDGRPESRPDEPSRAGGPQAEGEPASIRPVLSFGIQEARGGVGQGVLHNRLEVATEHRTEQGRVVRIESHLTTLLMAAERIRSAATSATLEEFGERFAYRAQPHPRRKIEIEIQGKSIEAQVEGLMPQAHHKLPSEMENPIVLDEDRLTSFQELFVRLLVEPDSAAAPEGLPEAKLAGKQLQVIVPSVLSLRYFEIEFIKREILTLPIGGQELLHVRVRRVLGDPRPGGRDQGAARERDFWITEAGVIVKMASSPEGVQAGHTLAYNHAFYPGFAGFRTVTGGVPGNGVLAEPFRSGGAKKRPALVTLTTDAGADRAIANRLHWQLPAFGWTQLALTNPESCPRGVQWLRKRPEVEPAKAVVLALGEAGARLCDRLGEESGGIGEAAGLILLNVAASAASRTLPGQVAALVSLDRPVLILWGDAEGDELREGRRAFAEAVRAAGGTKITFAPLASLNSSLREPTSVLHAPSFPDPLARSLLSELEKWVDALGKTGD